MKARPSFAKTAFTHLGVAAVHIAAGWISLRIVVIGGQVSPVWLPTGIALWALLTWGRQMVPTVFLSAAVVSLISGGPLSFTLLSALGNSLEPLLGATLLLHVFRMRTRLDRVQDVTALLVGSALISTLASAVLGTAGMVVSGLAPAAMAGGIFWVWWLGNGMGAVLTAPLLLTLRAFPWKRPSGLRLAELAGLVLLSLATGALVFSGIIPAEKTLYAQAFLIFPPAAWAALRFGPRGTAINTFAISSLALWATAHGQGPFATQVVVEGVVVLQLFMAVLVVSSQLLAAAFEERQRARTETQLLSGAIQDLHEGVLITDDDVVNGPRILYANAGFARLVASSPGLVVGETPWSFDGPQIDPDVRARLREALTRAEPFLAEWGLHRADGSHVQTELQVSPLKDVPEGTGRFVFVFRDVGDRKRMQAQLVMSDRMASIGLIAAGVGHEINNPLAFMALNLEMLERELAVPREQLRMDRARELLGDSVHGVQRVKEIVQSLRVLSRDASTEREQVDLHATLGLTLTLAKAQLRQVELRQELGTIPRVRGNEGRLGQVFLNLLINAVQALPEPGTGPREIRIVTWTDPAGRAVVEIRDTGEGIPARLMPRVFEPFFTTKERGQGTGLGLFICRQIVIEHGGELEIESVPGQGSAFRVLLPAIPGDSARPAETASPAAATPRRGRILIVDDEQRLARSMKMLLDAEHDVVVETDGEKAIALLLADARFDVILCDLQMPGVSGMELHERLSRAAPEAAERLIFISGGAYSEQARSFVARTTNRILEKPIPPQQLMAVVAEAVRDRRDSLHSAPTRRVELA